jgi:signal peptidase II
MEGQKMGKSWLRLRGINCKKVAVPLAVLVLALDQLSKLWVREALPPGASTPQEGFLRISHVSNPGLALGLGAHTTGLLLLPMAAAVVTSFIYCRYVPLKSKLLGVAMGLFVGGCLGNVLDRMALGGVTDFIDVNVSAGFGRLVFNVADLCCLAGIVVFSVFLIRLRFVMVPKRQYLIPYLWRSLVEAERRRSRTGQWWKPAPMKPQYGPSVLHRSPDKGSVAS